MINGLIQKQICNKEISRQNQQKDINIRVWNKNHTSPKVFKVFGLSLNSTIYSSKCSIKEIQKNKGQLAHISCLYNFFPTTCTLTKDVDLVWEEFAYFYIFIYSIIILLEHAIDTFPNLLHISDYQDVYRKKNTYHQLGQNGHCQVYGGWDPKNNNHEFECVSKVTKRHAGLTIN